MDYGKPRKSDQENEFDNFDDFDDLHSFNDFHSNNPVNKTESPEVNQPEINQPPEVTEPSKSDETPNDDPNLPRLKPGWGQVYTEDNCPMQKRLANMWREAVKRNRRPGADE